MKKTTRNTKKLTLVEAQKIVHTWGSNPKFKVGYFPPFQMLAQLMEEAGEVSREVAHLHGFKKKKKGEITDGLEIELGDVLFAVICLANYHELNLAEIFQKSMDKRNNRDNSRFEKKPRN